MLHYMLPTHGREIAPATDSTGDVAGDILFGTGGTAFTDDDVYSTNVTIVKSVTTANSNGVIRIYGYNHLDQLVTEDIANRANDTSFASVFAYKKILSVEWVTPPVTDSNWSIIVSGSADFDYDGVDGAANPACKVGLPFMPVDHKMIPCIQLVQDGTVQGWFRYDEAADDYELTQSSTNPDDTSVSVGAVVDIVRGTVNVPTFTATSGIIGITVHIDPAYQVYL